MFLFQKIIENFVQNNYVTLLGRLACVLAVITIAFIPIQASALSSFEFSIDDIFYLTEITETGAEVSYNVTATNNGSPVTATCTPPSGSPFSVGDTTVSCSATDSGEIGTATFIITVGEDGSDSTPPSITAPPDVIVYQEEGQTDPLTFADLGGLPIVTDDFDPSPLVTNDFPTSEFPLGVSTVTWTATDISGNSNTATQTVTVFAFIDGQVTPTPPGGSYNSAQSVTLSSGSPPIYYTTDGSTPTTSSAIYSTPIPVTSDMVLTFWSLDVSYLANATYTIDAAPPVISLNGASPVTVLLGSTYVDDGATAIDNVDGDLTTSIVTVNPVDTSSIGTYTVTYNVSDSAGNAAAQVTRTVQVTTGGATVIHMSDTAPGTGQSINAARQIHAEFVTPASELVGDKFDIITLKLKKSGLPTGTAQIGVFNEDQTLKHLISTLDVSTLTGSYTEYTFSGPVYEIEAGDRIGIKFDGGDAINYIAISRDMDPTFDFDGVNAYHTYFTTGWAEFFDRDLFMILEESTVPGSTDEVPPVITLVDASPVTIQQNAVYSDAGATAADDVDGDITASIVTSNPVNTALLGAYTVTYNVSDAAGNAAAQVTRTVNVVDDTLPTVASSPPDGLYGEVQNVTLTPSIPSIIYYTTNGDAPTTASPVYNSPIPVGTNTTVKFFAQSLTGNSGPEGMATYSFDAIAPVITLEGDEYVVLDLNEPYVDAGATAFDDPDGDITASIVTTNPVDITTLGLYIITYEVSDAAGNTTTETRRVDVGDQVPPEITVLGDNPVEIEQGSLYVDAGATANDNVDGNITGSISTTISVDTSVLGQHTVTYNVMDAALNTAPEVTRFVNVVLAADTEKPVIHLNAGDESIEYGGVYSDAGATVTDNDPNYEGTVFLNAVIPVDTFNPGDYLIEYAATADAAGNIPDMKTRVVTVLPDTIKPVIDPNGISHSVWVGSDPYSELGANVTDNDPTYSETVVVGGDIVNTAILGNYTVTYNAPADEAGNVPDQRTITVYVLPAPPIGNITFDTSNGNVCATDPCTLTIDVASGEDRMIVVALSVEGPINPLDSIDVNGGTGQGIDIGSETVGAGSTQQTVEMWIVMDDDIIDGTNTLTLNFGGSPSDAGVTLLALSSVAQQNPFPTPSATITSSDNVFAPITTPVDNSLIVTVMGHGQTGVPYSSFGDDQIERQNFSIPSAWHAVTTEIKPTQGGESQIGYTTPFSVNRHALFSAAFSPGIGTSEDTEKPVITPDSGSQSIAFNSLFVIPDAIVTDNDPEYNGVATATGTVNTTVPGDHTIIYSAPPDAGGNVPDDVSIVITVLSPTDATIPVITLLGTTPITILKDSVYTDDGATALDDIDGDLTPSIVTGGLPLDTSTPGSFDITYDVTDSSGNDAIQVTRTVNVVTEPDDTPPVITLLGVTPVDVEVGSIYGESEDAGATASDDVDGNITPSIVTGGLPVDTSSLVPKTVTYDVTDAAGNDATQVTRTVNVVDTTAPVITVSGNNPVDVEQGTPYGTAEDAGATALDNYDGDLTASIVEGGLPVDTSSLGPKTVTYDVTDSEGNVATQATRTVNVVVNPPPVITLLGVTPIDVEVGSPYVDAGATALDSSDGDLTASIVEGGLPVDTSTLGQRIVTYDVDDLDSNSATQVTRTVNVVDTTPPVITVTGDNPIEIEQGTTYGAAEDAGATALDNYDGDLNASIVEGGLPVDTSTLGPHTVTYDVTDSEGNVATQATRTVNVVPPPDTTPPVITLVGSDPVDAELGSTYTDDGATASDDVDGDITASIVEGGLPVDTSSLGSKTVTYDVTDAAGNGATQVTRTVNVVDTTAPVISPVGSTTTIAINSTYTEQGATVSDNDPAYAESVTISGTVNTAIAGAYVITYSAPDDASGNTPIPVSITINVVSDVEKPEITVNGSSQTIPLDSVFVNPTATVSDNDPAYDETVTITGTVDTSTPGNHVLTYSAPPDAAGNVPEDAIITIIVLSPPGSGDITFDTLSTDECDTIPCSISITVAPGSDRMIIVASTVEGPLNLIDSIDVNGVPDQGLPVGSQQVGSGSTLQSVEMWRVPGSAIVDGANTIDVNFAGTPSDAGLTVLSFSGVKQQAEEAVATSFVTTDDEVSAALTTATDNALIVSVAGHGQTGVLYASYGDGQVERSNYPIPSAGGGVTTEIKPTAGPDTQSHVTSTAVNRQAQVAAAFEAAAGSGPDNSKPVIVPASGSQSIEFGSTFDIPTANVIDNDPEYDGVASVSGTVDTLVEGDHVLTYTAPADNAGNVPDPVSITITVLPLVDIEKPVITPDSGDQTIPFGSEFTTPTATVTDNDPAYNEVATVSGTVDTSTSGDYVLTYTAPADNAGNVPDPVSITITVGLPPDTEKPVITVNGANHSVPFGSTFVPPTATVTDNDPAYNETVTITNGVDTSVAGDYPVSYSAPADNAGNVPDGISLTITVLPDAEKPVITPDSGDQTIPFGSEFTPPGSTVIDNDPAYNEVATISGTVDTSIAGDHVLTYTAPGDAAGNVPDPVSITITVEGMTDTEKPVITVDGTSTSIPFGSEFTPPTATVTDNDPTYLEVVTVTGTVDTSIAGDHVLTYTAPADEAGNVPDPVLITITVEEEIVPDTTPPVITLTGLTPIDVEAGSVYVDAGATAADDVDGDITASIIAVNPVNTAILGPYTVTYDVTDSAANPAAQVTRTVNVVDTTPPVITLTGLTPIDVELNSVYVDEGATALDNLDGDITALIVTGGLPVDTTTLGPQTVTYDVTDSQGNVAVQITRTVNVVADTPPVITLTGLTPIDVATGSVYVDAGATALDTVDGDITALIVTGGLPIDTSIPGVNIVTYDVTDSAGNAAVQVTRTVNVLESTEPVVHMSDTTVSTGQSLNSARQIHAEYVTGASQLIGDKIDTITVKLKKSGLPTGTVQVGVFNAGLGVERLFSSFDASILTGSFTDYTFSLPAGQSYEIKADDRIGVKFPGGDATNFVAIMRDIDPADPFDGVNSYHTYYTTGWVSFIDRDLYMILQGNSSGEGSDTQKPVITPNGVSQTLNVGDPYTELGATVSDNDVSYSEAVTIGGDVVDTSAVGVYVVTYNAPADAAGNIPDEKTITITVVVPNLPTIHMSDTTISSGQSLYVDRQIHAEFVSATSSLVGDDIDTITIMLKKGGLIGLPTGTAEIGIFAPDLSVKQLFGTLDVSTLTGTYTEYTFSLPEDVLYNIEAGDRIGIKYAGGDAVNNFVAIMRDIDPADPFDGISSYHTYYTISWVSFIDRDLYMILSQSPTP